MSAFQAFKNIEEELGRSRKTEEAGVYDLLT